MNGALFSAFIAHSFPCYSSVTLNLFFRSPFVSSEPYPQKIDHPGSKYTAVLIQAKGKPLQIITAIWVNIFHL